MSTDISRTEEEDKIEKSEDTEKKPLRTQRRHRKREGSKYDTLKVYSTSKKSSKERLQKKIMESKEKASLYIPWDQI